MPGRTPSGRTPPADHGTDSRPAAEARLDPVRWRVPGRGTLIRLVTVAALLGTAGAAAWSGPEGCAPQRAGSTAPPGAAASRPPPPATAGSPAPTSPPGEGGPPGQDGPPGQGGPPGDGGLAPRAESAHLAVPPGAVGVPVRLAEQITTGLLRPGDRVSLFAVDGTGGPATPVADEATVLAVTAAGDVGADAGLLVALQPADAKRALATPRQAGFAVTITSGR